jgi:two-component system, chemotaxis family, chemotaxis protein CheY
MSGRTSEVRTWRRPHLDLETALSATAVLLKTSYESTRRSYRWRYCLAPSFERGYGDQEAETCIGLPDPETMATHGGSGSYNTEGTVARILIIDDEEQIRRLLRYALERAGYEIIEACDGDEGVQCYRTAAVDLIISDILLTDQGGFETITALRHEAPGIKIIAMSGGGYLGDGNLLDIARQLGAQRTLQKPFELGDLFATVWEALQDSDV